MPVLSVGQQKISVSKKAWFMLGPQTVNSTSMSTATCRPLTSTFESTSSSQSSKRKGSVGSIHWLGMLTEGRRPLTTGCYDTSRGHACAGAAVRS